MSVLEQRIRDYVNRTNLYDRRFRSCSDEWNTLCVAMDTLGDTCLALKYYEDFGIGNEDGEKYLKLYGLLQAVFVQQDAIRQLYKTFVGTALRPDSGSGWMRIRELRNLTVGHPIASNRGGRKRKIRKNERTETRRCFISRVTVRSDGFQLLIWDKDRGEDHFENVNLRSLYDSYKLEAVGYLEAIQRAQVEKWGPFTSSEGVKARGREPTVEGRR